MLVDEAVVDRPAVDADRGERPPARARSRPIRTFSTSSRQRHRIDPSGRVSGPWSRGGRRRPRRLRVEIDHRHTDRRCTHVDRGDAHRVTPRSNGRSSDDGEIEIQEIGHLPDARDLVPDAERDVVRGAFRAPGVEERRPGPRAKRMREFVLPIRNVGPGDRLALGRDQLEPAVGGLASGRGS